MGVMGATGDMGETCEEAKLRELGEKVVVGLVVLRNLKKRKKGSEFVEVDVEAEFALAVGDRTSDGAVTLLSPR